MMTMNEESDGMVRDAASGGLVFPKEASGAGVDLDVRKVV